MPIQGMGYETKEDRMKDKIKRLEKELAELKAQVDTEFEVGDWIFDRSEYFDIIGKNREGLEMKAFPVHEDVPQDDDFEGMDLRDYFAAKALTLIPFMASTVYRNPETWGTKEITEECYRIADAMMEARND